MVTTSAGVNDAQTRALRDQQSLDFSILIGQLVKFLVLIGQSGESLIALLNVELSCVSGDELI